MSKCNEFKEKGWCNEYCSILQNNGCYEKYFYLVASIPNGMFLNKTIIFSGTEYNFTIYDSPIVYYDKKYSQDAFGVKSILSITQKMNEIIEERSKENEVSYKKI